MEQPATPEAERVMMGEAEVHYNVQVSIQRVEFDPAALKSGPFSDKKTREIRDVLRMSVTGITAVEAIDKARRLLEVEKEMLPADGHASGTPLQKPQIRGTQA